MSSKSRAQEDKSKNRSSSSADSASSRSEPLEKQTTITSDSDAIVNAGINFMSKFRDKDTRVLKNLNSSQFIEVWNNYDKDGKSTSLRCFFIQTTSRQQLHLSNLAPPELIIA